MADHTKNLTNPVRTFGGGPASLWNAYNWNAFNWGEGTAEFTHSVVHVYSNSQPATSAVGSKQVLHYAEAQTVTPTDAYAKAPTFNMPANAVTVSGDNSNETLQDGAGYSYVFPSNATNLEDRDDVTWTPAAEPTSSWTSATEAATVWS